MPPAQQVHRTWGTRYDSLVDAVPAPSSSPPNANNNHSFRPSNHGNSIINTPGIRIIPSATTPPSFPLHNDAVKERAHMQPQHQDEKYSERLQNMNSNPERYSYPNQYSPTGVHARMPHDASVFVASLPSHLADPELQALLTEHLNHHATIKHVKLIRDNRNAVCAFVQVQSSTEATELIDKCNLSLFMDRQIRCERARAFRTLLVSWVKQGESNHTSSARHVPSPQPLRLRRCRGSRFVQITSGADAFCADPQQLANCSLPRPDDPLSGTGVFFESGVVEDDLESLKRLMKAFGPLEFMMPFDPKIHQTTGDNEIESNTVDDIGGTADRTPKDPVKIENENIDGMWAVKWEHRNDAVSAITALQAIGNLCVRWCHTYGQTISSSTGLTADTGHSSNPSTPYRPVHHSNPTTPHRPRVFAQSNQWYNGNGSQHKQDQYHNNHGYPFNYDQNSSRGRFNHGNNSGVIGPAVHRSAKLPLSFSESDFPPLNGNPNSSENSTENNVNDNTSEPGAGTRLGYSSDETPRRRDIENSTVWNGDNSTFSRSNAPSPSPPHESQPILPSLWLPLETTPNTSIVADANNNMSDRTDSSEGEVIPCTPETPDLEPEIEGADGSASGVETPLTPGFPETPHTPRSAYISSLSFCNDKSGVRSGMEHGKANGHGSKISLQDNMAGSPDGGFLIDHTSSHIRTSSTSKSVNVSLITKHPHQHHPSQSQLDHDQERDGDEYVMVSPTNSPTTSVPASDRELFVGGLSVDSWGEERLRNVFSQYGPIEELRFVKPYHAPVHRRGFAFVRYVKCEDAQKAIHGQHMRLYDDHKIKVQLRDTHPNSRRPQWNHRGRARYNQGQGHSHHAHDREDDTKQNSPSSGRVSPDQSPDEERLVPPDEVTPKYPCITDPLSEEEEAAFRRDFIYDKNCVVIHQPPPNTRSPDARFSPTSPLTSPPRADSVHRATRSESGLHSPPPTSNADALSTYAPSSIESAPPSSSYYAYPSITNAWVPPYTLYAPSSHDYSHPGNNTATPSAQSAPSDPWMGIYRNMLPAVPWFNPPPGVELTTAPLHPTGYIQRDGIFIPVYPPERLGQYMCSTSNGTDNVNGSSDGQQARTTSPSTTVNPKTATPPATNTPPWTMASTHPHQTYAYPMPYAVPPHAMMLPPHMTHPSYQAQWVSSPPYPPTATQPHGYTNGQQNQQQPQQHVPYVPIAVNGYPLYCPQQSQVNGQPPAYYPRSSFGVYDSTSSAPQVQGQVPVMGQPGGGAQPQVQQNYGPGKPGNGNRRDYNSHHYRGNATSANGRPGRRGTSNGGSGMNSSAGGNGQPQPTNSTSPRAARVPINALPLQVTTA